MMGTIIALSILEVFGFAAVALVCYYTFMKIGNILKEYERRIDKHASYVDANLDVIVELLNQHIAEEESDDLDFDQKF